MRNSPAYDVANILRENGVGELGKNIFATKEVPPKPDKILFIMNTGTYEEPSARLTYRYPMVQVVARGAAGEFSECTDRMFKVDEILHGITSAVLESNRYVFIYRVSEPIDLDYDETMRPFIGANYRMNMTRDYRYKEQR